MTSTATARSLKADLNRDLLHRAEEIEYLCRAVLAQSDVLVQIVETLSRALSSRHRVFVCGNGGSASLSQHFSSEFVGRFGGSTSAWPVIALTSDSSVLTALANDFDYRDVFTRQLEALGTMGDVLLVLSTSGISRSITDACRWAQGSGLMTTIGLIGCSAAPALACDLLLTLPDGTETPQAQEMHLTVLHLICRRVRALLDAGWC